MNLAYSSEYFKYKKLYVETGQTKEWNKDRPEITEIFALWEDARTSPMRKPWIIREDRLLNTKRAEYITHDPKSGIAFKSCPNIFLSRVGAYLRPEDEYILVEDSKELQKEFEAFCNREED